MMITWTFIVCAVLIPALCTNLLTKCPCYKRQLQHYSNKEKNKSCILEDSLVKVLSLKDFYSDCIRNVTNFTLSNTQTQSIESGFFGNFTKLKILTVGNIRLTHNITPAFKGIQNTMLETLKLEKVATNDDILENVYSQLPPNLTELLLLEINHLTTFPLHRIQSLERLNTLFLNNSMSFRHFVFENISKPLPLKTLSVANTSYFWTSVFKNNEKKCVLPYLENFNLSHTFVNVSTTMGKADCLENLKVLDLQHCIFEDGLYNDSFRLLPKLQRLIISEAINIYQLPLLNNSLTHLEMNKIQFNFNATPDNLNIFGNLERLQHLEIRCLNLGQWSDGDFEFLLKPLTNLQYFDASDNNLTVIPKAFLKMHMLQTVILENNLITQWHREIFQSENLTELRLQNNLIEYLDTRFIPSTVEKLNLSHNPFLCTCDLVPFIIWVKERKKLYHDWFDDWRHRYICACPKNKQNKSLSEFNPKPTDCQPFNKIVITAMVLCCLMVVIVFIAQLVAWHRERKGVSSKKPKYRRLDTVS